MKRILLALVVALGLSPAPALAQGVPSSAQVVNNCGTPPSTYTPGQNQPLLQDTTGRQCITSGGSSTNTNVNVQQIGGSTVVTSASGVQEVGAVGSTGVALDSAAGTPNAQAVTIQGNASGVAVPTAPSPSSSSGIGITPVVSTAAESGHVLKASAGNLYSISASALTSTAGYVMVFNSTTVPADGSVTPILCIPIAATPALVNIAYGSGPPAVFSTGISVSISSTGCATKTAISSGAWFTGAVK